IRADGGEDGGVRAEQVGVGGGDVGLGGHASSNLVEVGNIPQLSTVGGCMQLRADAARNREAIVDAARAAFAEQGLLAPLDDIAKQAGTGNATLYRRFPTRGDLIEAVFADRMAEHL